MLYQKKPINQKLNKMIPLPNVIAWKVNPADVLHRGRVMCMFRTKRTFLPDDISSLKMRMTTVTRNGDMIVYDTKDRGLIINLRDATDVLTECDKYKSKKVKYSRSHIKIRMPRGNIHLFVRDEAIYKWSAAILEAHVYCRPKPFVLIRKEIQSHQESVTAIEKAPESPTSPMTSSNSGLITVIEKRSTSEDTLIPSVRRGAVPVGTLRCKIEKEIEKNPKVEMLPEPTTSQQKPSQPASSEQKHITSFFVLHEGGIRTQGIPVQVKTEPLDDDQKTFLNLERPEEESKGSAKKEWWMRSLKC
ncbi:hypothetical protein CRE_07915 [Caenorhabditis remanei]|uniref:DUF7778 domain-containing protein n=1 Tax=Caenorhabditis remanei TaxID=31234 RepID=E3NPK0_CAERE|nr:hypothetical protein CRE_07915 [Caenorhabditis remanei]